MDRPVPREPSGEPFPQTLARRRRGRGHPSGSRANRWRAPRPSTRACRRRPSAMNTVGSIRAQSSPEARPGASRSDWTGICAPMFSSPVLHRILVNCLLDRNFCSCIFCIAAMSVPPRRRDGEILSERAAAIRPARAQGRGSRARPGRSRRSRDGSPRDGPGARAQTRAWPPRSPRSRRRAPA